MAEKKARTDSQWKALSRNDWGEILALAERKSFQRKFQFVEAFAEIGAYKGFHSVTYSDVAKKCKTTRQLVSHHFVDHEMLIGLTYRYIYAQFQKLASDALLARMGFRSRLEAYVDAVADWVSTHRSHARFLVQWYAFLHVREGFVAMHERNMRIGEERLAALCEQAQADEALFTGVDAADLARRCASVQKLLLGYVTILSGRAGAGDEKLERAELKRSLLAILGLQSISARPGSRAGSMASK
jgi:AcrR family transcriptional regulator